MLVDKVNKGDVYTKTEIEETLYGFVSSLPMKLIKLDLLLG